jgi:hypothetical protein
MELIRLRAPLRIFSDLARSHSSHKYHIFHIRNYMLISWHSSFSYSKFATSFRTPEPFSERSNPSQTYNCLAVTWVMLSSPGGAAFPKDITPADSALASSPSSATSVCSLSHVSAVPSAFFYPPHSGRPYLSYVRLFISPHPVTCKLTSGSSLAYITPGLSIDFLSTLVHSS